MKIGYARVSTTDQKMERQPDSLTKEGCERIYQEKISGVKKDRPELNRMLDALREGDIILVCELTRLSRSVKDLFELVEQIHKCGADVRSLKEPWLDTTTPHGKLLFSLFAGVSQFERDLIRERTLEGLASARARGRHGGRPAVDLKKLGLAMKLYKSKEYSIAEIEKASGIGKSTLYKYISKQAQNKDNDSL